MNYNSTLIKIAFIIFLSSLSVNAKAFKIALIHPDKGPMADCMCISNALLEEAKENGLDIEFYKFSNNNSVIGTIEAVKKAITAQVDVVIGPSRSQEALAASRLLNSVGIVYIAPEASHPDITKEKPYSLRLVSTSYRYSYLISQIIAKISPQKIIVIRNISIPYSQFYSIETTKNLKKLSPNTKVKFIDIIDNFNNFSKLAKHIISYKPDILYLPLYTEQVAHLLTELAKHNPRLQIFSHGGISDGKNYFYMVTKSAPNIELNLNEVWDRNFSSPYKRHFTKLRKKYCSEYHNLYRLTMSYDSVNILINALKSNPSLRGIQLIKYIKNRYYAGVSGKIVYDKSGEPIRPLPLLQIRNGREKFIGVIN